MSTLGTTLPGLLEANIFDKPGGDGYLDIINSLMQTEEMLMDIPWFPANGRDFHKYDRLTSLVSGTWVNINDGISASKGAWKTDNARLGRLESRLIIDPRMRDYESDFEAYVARMAEPHYQGLANDASDAIINGTVSGGYAFPSIEEHISSASQTDEFGQTMFHTYGGSATLTSIIAVQWGNNQVYGVYPKGHRFAGVEKFEMGENNLTSGNNSSDMRSYVCDFAWAFGLVLADDRCIRRIGNIEPTGTSKNMLDSSFKLYPVIDGLASMKDMGKGAVLYMNRSVWAIFWKAALGQANTNYTAANPWEEPQRYFDGHRVRFTDSLLNTESQVT